MVWVKNGEYIHPTIIEVGIDDGSNIEVISGLEEGSLLVTSFELISHSIFTKSNSENNEQVSPFVQERVRTRRWRMDRVVHLASSKILINGTPENNCTWDIKKSYQ